MNLLFVEVNKSERNLLTNEKYKEIQQLKEKVNRILSIISRDHMKVVFFGRFVNCNEFVECHLRLYLRLEQVMGKVQP